MKKVLSAISKSNSLFGSVLRQAQAERNLRSSDVRGEPYGGVYPEQRRRAQDRLVEPPFEIVP